MKMRLLIDIGNTNIVYGLTDGIEIKKKWRTCSNINLTEDEIGLSILNYLRLFNANVEAAIISCVVPKILPAMQNGIKKYLGLSAQIVDCNVKSNLVWDIENPAELGADRIVNCIGAFEIYHSDLIVIDFGTATTYDLIDSSGKFLTGITAPGIKISADALYNKTSLLSETNLILPKDILVKNTADSLRAGIILTNIGAAEYIIKKLLGVLPNAKVIATGGLCNLIETDLIDVKDLDLTLKGLMILS